MDAQLSTSHGSTVVNNKDEDVVAPISTAPNKDLHSVHDPQEITKVETKKEHPTTPVTTPKKPSVLSRAWKKLGFTPTVFMIMIKPAIAATISMAIYQKHAVARNYYNFGYLTIIISITTVPILPRGKFLVNLFVTVFLTCFAAAMVLLGQYAGIKAREATTAPKNLSSPAYAYNSSASAVNAIFLMLNVFLISVLRAARPVFGIPSIQYIVFVMVGFTYGPLELTQARSLLFVREVFYAFLTGQAISCGVALFIIPVSSRKVFFTETTGFLQTCRGLLQAQLEFVNVLEEFKLSELTAQEGNENSEEWASYKQKAAALKQKSAGLLSLAGKLREDVIFAKREMAIGHLRETHIHEIHGLIEGITYPITGVSTIADISERMHQQYADESGSPEFSLSQAALDSEQEEWQRLVTTLTVSLGTVVAILDESILHILLLLRLVPGPKKGKKGTDVNGEAEKGSSTPKAGDAGFGDYLEAQIASFREVRSADVQKWAEERGYNSIFQSTVKNATQRPESTQGLDPKATAREILASKRLHVVLYMEYLIYSVARAILAMVRFAELKKEDGTWTRIRFIFPAMHTLIKWAKGLWSGDEANNEEIFDQVVSNAQTVYLGDSFQRPKDPEHLPPKNWFQAWGDHLRAVPRFLGSAPVAFGVRVTVAVMCIGILAFLKDTHVFFVKQRVVWCLVMTAVGMSPTTGSAVFSLFWSLISTIAGMAGAFINWYVADQNTAAIIVLFFITIQIYFYFAARYPRFLVAIVAGALTHVLAIGYELQVRVIGLQIATATGQPYYPIYELAPYRLLAVGAGLIIAYIFTIFPVPISESSVLRRNLGNSILLLAKYMNATTATVDFRLSEKEGDISLKDSPGRKLQKIRKRTLQKEVALINSMRQNISFLDWEPRLGGDFPKKTYQLLVEEVQNVTEYLTIISYASESFPTAHSHSPWLSSFAASRSSASSSSHTITSLLALLSSSLLNTQPLPPYLRTPTDFRLSDELVSEGTHVLALENLNEPGFRAIAVIEVAQRCLVSSVDRIVELMKELVGEIDFSVSYSGGSNSASESVLAFGANGTGNVEGRKVKNA